MAITPASEVTMRTLLLAVQQLQTTRKLIHETTNKNHADAVEP